MKKIQDNYEMGGFVERSMSIQRRSSCACSLGAGSNTIRKDPGLKKRLWGKQDTSCSGLFPSDFLSLPFSKWQIHFQSTKL